MGTFFGSYVIYRIYMSNSESGKESWISNLITKWTPSEKVFEERNALHTVAAEKAAHDRHLFMAQSQRETVGIRSPEYVALSLWEELQKLTYISPCLDNLTRVAHTMSLLVLSPM